MIASVGQIVSAFFAQIPGATAAPLRMGAVSMDRRFRSGGAFASGGAGCRAATRSSSFAGLSDPLARCQPPRIAESRCWMISSWSVARKT